MESEIDALLSQIVEEAAWQTAGTDSACSKQEAPPPNPRFAKPKTDEDVAEVQKRAQPKTTVRTTKWALCIWKTWSESRQKIMLTAPTCLLICSP